MKKSYQKVLKKSTLFFLLNPVPFNRQIYQKQNGSGTSDQSLFQNSIISYALSIKFYDVIESGFRSIPKITSANFCKLTHDIINYSTSKLRNFAVTIVPLPRCYHKLEMAGTIFRYHKCFWLRRKCHKNV